MPRQRRKTTNGRKHHALDSAGSKEWKPTESFVRMCEKYAFGNSDARTPEMVRHNITFCMQPERNGHNCLTDFRSANFAQELSMATAAGLPCLLYTSPSPRDS